MLSQLSSFLPEALQPKEAKSQPPPHQQHPPSPPSEAETDAAGPTSLASDELGVRKKEKKSNEAFIIVRPPPSKSNHPLNLQVQLVPPSAKERTRRISLDSTADDAAVLARTSSRTTDAGSVYSSYSSAGSVASVNSTSTASSGRRMIIPLYNLQAHNVLTNCVADAGTDAKIAKFHKRGMEVIGLAVLEPTEVYGLGGSPTTLETQGHSNGLMQVPTNLSSARGVSPEPGHTPSSSRISLSSAGHHPNHPPPPAEAPAAAAAPPTAQPQQSGAKKLFGRFFKKKDAAAAVAASPVEAPTTPTRRSFLPTPNTTPRASSTTPSAPSKRSSLLLPPQPSGSAEPAPVLMPAVLGVQPSLSASTYPPHGRPNAYTWTVRRWLKGPNTDGLFGNVAGMLGAALPGIAGSNTQSAGAVELRFEWTRGVKKGGPGGAPPGGKATPRRPRKHSRGSGERPHSVHFSRDAANSSTSLASNGQKVRDYASRPRSNSPKRGASGDAHSVATASEGHDTLNDDDGDESDPEDSETPWACTLVVRRIVGTPPAATAPASHSPLSPLSASSNSNEVRIKVATLSPTPHHPKVVAALKVPFPLPDIDVYALSVRKRVLTPAGIARPAPMGGEDGSDGSPTSPRPGAEVLMLTAEETKDLVCTTGMWLVVREGIGGVGRVARKGDGWKLRS